MSAILSADDLNDFISPGVACIKPVETLPKQQPSDNPYEVTTEDKVAAAEAPPASISLTDCLACSGCVTSAEAVLVSLQSHAEVLNTLDAYPEWRNPKVQTNGDHATQPQGITEDGKIFVASVSPQTRASIAATYGITEREAGHLITQLLSGPQGLRSGGRHGSGFTWVIDTNVVREAALVAAADEVVDSQAPDQPKRPILTSACPGWICYAEKTHPHVLPHISRLKSPQALAGTLVKSVLARQYGIAPDKIWHMAVMPCFDKKLEASRAELTDTSWQTADAREDNKSVRDVDCVITARELLMLADARGIIFPSLPRKPLRKSQRTPFPDTQLDRFLFPSSRLRQPRVRNPNGSPEAGSSGGYLWHIMQTYRSRNPGSELMVQRGRNVDVVEYSLVNKDTNKTIVKAARYYGFRNIQNLVRRLKPPKVSRMAGAASRMGGARKPGGASTGGSQGMDEYAYVEVMACPGGCTNGGGQIKAGDVGALSGSGIENGGDQVVAPAQKEWLARIDEAYFSADSSEDAAEEQVEDDDEDSDMQDAGTETTEDEGYAAEGNTSGQGDMIDGISRRHIKGVLEHWAIVTGIDLDRLLYTSYRKVESDVGKTGNDVERVAGLASTIGGGW